MAEELEFQIKNSMGQIISGRVYMPESISEPRPVIIFAHGYAATYKRVENHCKRIAEQGYPSIAFDFRGGSEESKSDGKFADMTIETEIVDLKCVIQFAKKLAIADHDRIYVMGESLGGLVTLLAVADKDVDVRGVALWYPTLIAPDIARRRLNNEITEYDVLNCTPKFDEVTASIDIFKKIDGLKIPLLIVVGEYDTVVPMEMFEKTIETVKDGKLVVIEGQGHRFDDETAVKVCDICRDYFLSKL